MTRRAFLLVLLALPCRAEEPAVVRLPSHGASAAVIESSSRRTLILTCAHAFDDARGRGKPVVVSGPPGLTSAKLVAVDYDRDLALLEAAPGRYPFLSVASGVTPTAAALRSAGYDLGGPQRDYPARVVRDEHRWLYTAEVPRHGRSGGPLYDPGRRTLSGVVSGYVDSPEGRRGIYANARSVRDFLADYRAGLNRVRTMPRAD